MSRKWFVSIAAVLMVGSFWIAGQQLQVNIDSENKSEVVAGNSQSEEQEPQLMEDMQDSEQKPESSEDAQDSEQKSESSEDAQDSEQKPESSDDAQGNDQEIEKPNNPQDNEQETQLPNDTQGEQESAPSGVKEIVISAVGDCTLGSNQKHEYKHSFHEYYDKYGAEYFLKNVKDIFENDDFTMINLEGALTDSDTIRETKEWNHKGKPEYVEVLTSASVEAVTLGNNHIMDYQKDGVRDTINTVKDAGIVYGLSGDWGHQLGLYETDGIKIGFASVNEYYDGKRVYQWLEDGLKDLREMGADIVIAANHWGGDKVHEIDDDQRKLGKWCIDQGFDLVLGCHPHVLQGIEKYKDKYIVYSMGNFCYGGNKNPSEKESMIFQIKFTFVDGVLQLESDAKVIPCRLSSVTNKNDYCPVILEGKEAQEVIENMNIYSQEFGLVIDEEGNILK